MKHILFLFCHIVLVIAVQRLAEREVQFRKSHSFDDLSTRSPGQHRGGRSSRGTTPEKKRISPRRSKSLPPARDSNRQKEAAGLGTVEGKGRISTVGEYRRKRAELKTTLVHSQDSVKVAGNSVSVTGQTFSDDSKMLTEASGALGITSKITTQAGAKGYIRAQAPGQATIRVNLEGNANAEVILPNQDPHLGCSRVECFIWGRGSSHLTAQGIGKRTIDGLEPD